MDLEALLRARDLSLLEKEKEKQPPAPQPPPAAPRAPKQSGERGGGGLLLPSPPSQGQGQQGKGAEGSAEAAVVGPLVPLAGSASPFPAFGVREEAEEWGGGGDGDGVDGEVEARLRRYLQEEEDKELAAFILKRGARGRGRGRRRGGEDSSDDDDDSEGEEEGSEAGSEKGGRVVVVKGCEDEAYERGPAAEEAFLRFQVRFVDWGLQRGVGIVVDCRLRSFRCVYIYTYMSWYYDSGTYRGAPARCCATRTEVSQAFHVHSVL